MTQENINKIFESDRFKHIDVLFVTSDDCVFALPEQAMAHSTSLADKQVQSWFRVQEAQLRIMAEPQSLLERMIIVTDYVKQHKFRHIPAASYEAYKAHCDKFNTQPVERESYDFVVKNVYKKTNILNMRRDDMEDIHMETADGHKILKANLVYQ